MSVDALFKDFTSVCDGVCVCVCVCLDGKNNFPEKLRYDINVHNIHSKSILQ